MSIWILDIYVKPKRSTLLTSALRNAARRKYSKLGYLPQTQSDTLCGSSPGNVLPERLVVGRMVFFVRRLNSKSLRNPIGSRTHKTKLLCATNWFPPECFGVQVPTLWVKPKPEIWKLPKIRGPQHRPPKYYNPYYKDTQKDTPNFGKPPYIWRDLKESSPDGIIQDLLLQLARRPEGLGVQGSQVQGLRAVVLRDMDA